MTKVDRVYRKVRERFAERLDAAFKAKFRRNLKTEFNLLAMRLISVPTNGKKLTPAQRDWIAGYSEGYIDAKEQIVEQP